MVKFPFTSITFSNTLNVVVCCQRSQIRYTLVLTHWLGWFNLAEIEFLTRRLHKATCLSKVGVEKRFPKWTRELLKRSSHVRAQFLSNFHILNFFDMYKVLIDQYGRFVSVIVIAQMKWIQQDYTPPSPIQCSVNNLLFDYKLCFSVVCLMNSFYLNSLLQWTQSTLSFKPLKFYQSLILFSRTYLI